MEALVLERKGELSLRDIDLPLEVGSHDVKSRTSFARVAAITLGMLSEPLPPRRWSKNALRYVLQ
jgi:hypothetical protein